MFIALQKQYAHLSTDTKVDAKPSNFSLLKAYSDLSKARLSALVVATTAAGFLAAGGPLTTMTAACAGTMLCSSSAAAFNQIFEVDRDSQMKRTQQRPLVKGTLSAGHATLAASVWGISGTGILALGTDPYTTALGAANIMLYAGLYTYMKPRTVWNTWVGAVVGAIPPVMGWSAATGGSVLDVEAMLLYGTLYYWQLPHFMALSYMHRVDYARGGFEMVPVKEENGDETSKIIVRNAWLLSTIPVLSTLTNVTSSMFALEGFLLNGYALHVAYQFRYDRTNAKARKIFLTSLWYLPSFLVLFLLHAKTWDEKESEDNILRGFISKYVHIIRENGRAVCLHEAVLERSQKSENACPVLVVKKTSNSVDEETASAITTALNSSKNENNT